MAGNSILEAEHDSGLGEKLDVQMHSSVTTHPTGKALPLSVTLATRDGEAGGSGGEVGGAGGVEGGPHRHWYSVVHSTPVSASGL